MKIKNGYTLSQITLLGCYFMEISTQLFPSFSSPFGLPPFEEEYDFIIVGAGSAGCVLANRLTEISGWTVLILEAGIEETELMDIPAAAPFLQFSNINWNYATVPSKDYCIDLVGSQCRYPRGKVTGGSSVLNYMIYTRGNRRDYDNWANMGNTGWGYQDVLPYFKKLEDVEIMQYEFDLEYRGTHGQQIVTRVPFHSPVTTAFIQAGKEMGYPSPDINGATQVGFSLHQMTMKNGSRWSANRAYLQPVQKRKNLHLKISSFVTKILINEVTKTAWGVEYIKNNVRFRARARKEVIVAGGAINSPQLLMLSGIGPKNHLISKGIRVIQDLPVGENLMDHVGTGAFFITMTESLGMLASNIFTNAGIVSEYLKYRQGPLSVPAGTTALAFIDTLNLTNPDGHPDIELLYFDQNMNCDLSCGSMAGLSGNVMNAVYGAARLLTGATVVPMILRPKSRGRILLATKNPHTHPLIYPDYFTHPADLEALVRGVRFMERLLRSPSYSRLKAAVWPVPITGCELIPFNTDAYWKCATRHFPITIYHYSGTCKMGPAGDPTAVVDPRLRVRGIKQLRVIDSSIIPMIPAGHTNAPTIMIAEKGADMIKQDWGISIIESE